MEKEEAGESFCIYMYIYMYTHTHNIISKGGEKSLDSFKLGSHIAINHLFLSSV